MNLITAQGLGVRLGGRNVLNSVNFNVKPGEIVTIVGPNGSGKSTLLRCLVGALKPTKGRVITSKDLRIGYVPQRLVIDPTLPMTVERFLNLPKRQRPARVAEALEKAGVPQVAERQMAVLSGGQTQRVLLARALLNNPQILVLDEPTQGLDQPGSAAFYQQLEALRDTLGCAVVMVSHELHVVMAASDRVICLNGHICCAGTPEHVAQADEYRALFGSGTGGALALYRHEHDHDHHAHDHNHEAAE